MSYILQAFGEIATIKTNETPKGEVVQISMVNNRRVGDKTYTSWLNINFWGKTAERAKKYLAKGRTAQVDLRPNAANGKNDLIGYSFQVLSWGPKSNDTPGEEPQEDEFNE